MRYLLHWGVTLILGVAAGAAAAGDGPAQVEITWMSMANMHYQAGALGILTDGYFSRIPEGEFFGGGGGLAWTQHAHKPEVAQVRAVLESLGGPERVNLLLTGHSHWDHAFDTSTWWHLTGAPILGPQSTCLEVQADRVPASACRALWGGEALVLAPGISLRVVRWNHSGDPAINPEQHTPRELSAPPVPDAAGALRAGVAEDFPNGGGNRGFLFVVDGSRGRYAWFYQNSASAVDLDSPIVLDDIDYGAPIVNLEHALREAGLDRVDLWIGTGGAAVARQVVPVIRPRAYLPIHWDGLFEPFRAGMPWRFSDPELEVFLEEQGIELLRPGQFMDRWVIDQTGVKRLPDDSAKALLGFPPRAAVKPRPR